MKYNTYTVADFVNDEYFQQWVLAPETMADTFWNNWLAAHPEKAEMVQEARKLIQLMAAGQEPLPQADVDRMWWHIIEHRDKTTTHSERLTTRFAGRRHWWRMAAVWALLIMGLAGLYRWRYWQDDAADASETTTQVVLALQDGSIKVLDEQQQGDIATANGQHVVSQRRRVLDYRTQNQPPALGAPVFNELTVPYGKIFELILSDGSHVFLNAGSKLRYPVAFAPEKPRDVFLEGEGYFQVTKDKARPFTVITDQINTRVYGTKFNVSNYKNEHNTSTVLVEGSVGIYKSNNVEGVPPVMLTPGQRGLFNDEQLQVEKVNVDKYIAWTEGKLYFVNDRFDLILREMERHFNVAIDNQYTALKEKKFTGTFDVEGLEDILHVFQMYTPFEYHIQNNTVIIKAKT